MTHSKAIHFEQETLIIFVCLYPNKYYNAPGQTNLVFPAIGCGRIMNIHTNVERIVLKTLDEVISLYKLHKSADKSVDLVSLVSCNHREKEV